MLKQRVYGLFIVLLIGTASLAIMGAGQFFRKAAAQDPTPQAYPVETADVQSAYPSSTGNAQNAYPATTMDDFFLEDAADNTTAVLIGAFILVAIVGVMSGVFVLRKRRASKEK